MKSWEAEIIIGCIAPEGNAWTWELYREAGPHIRVVDETEHDTQSDAIHEAHLAMKRLGMVEKAK